MAEVAEVVVATCCEQGSERLGERLGRRLTAGAVVALVGPLGAGKTTLVRGIARGLGVGDAVTSPSFILVREHQGRLRLFHWDAYRLSGPDDIDQLPFEEHIRGDGVVVIEWADRIESAIPCWAVWVRIERPRAESPRERRFLLRGPDLDRLLAGGDATERAGH